MKHVQQVKFLKMTGGGTIVCEPVADDAGETVAIQQNPPLSRCEQCIDNHIDDAYIDATHLIQCAVLLIIAASWNHR